MLSFGLLFCLTWLTLFLEKVDFVRISFTLFTTTISELLHRRRISIILSSSRAMQPPVYGLLPLQWMKMLLPSFIVPSFPKRAICNSPHSGSSNRLVLTRAKVWTKKIPKNYSFLGWEFVGVLVGV